MFIFYEYKYLRNECSSIAGKSAFIRTTVGVQESLMQDGKGSIIRLDMKKY